MHHSAQRAMSMFPRLRLRWRSCPSTRLQIGPARACGNLANHNHTATAALLVYPQWQGEGGANASGIVQGCKIASQAIANVLPVDVPCVQVPVEPPRERPDIPPFSRVWWHDDLTLQTNACVTALDAVKPKLIFSAGGDCSSDLGPCSWLLGEYAKDLVILYLDAHADLNTADESPSGHFHGMWLRALLGDAPVGLAPRSKLPSSQLVYAGVRELDMAEKNEIHRLGIPVLTPADLREDTNRSVMRGLLEATGCHRLHIHLDLDVLDPRSFPHVSVPCPDGLEVKELCSILNQAVKCLPLVGLTVTELKVSEPRDEAYCRDVLQELLGPRGADLASCLARNGD